MRPHVGDGRHRDTLGIDGLGRADQKREVISDFCSPVLILAVAGVLQDPSDASLFSSSSRESHHRAAGEFGCQCMEMVPSKPGMA